MTENIETTSDRALTTEGITAKRDASDRLTGVKEGQPTVAENTKSASERKASTTESQAAAHGNLGAGGPKENQKSKDTAANIAGAQSKAGAQEVPSERGPYEAKFIAELERILAAPPGPGFPTGTASGNTQPWYRRVFGIVGKVALEGSGFPSLLLTMPEYAAPPIARLTVLSRKLSESDSSDAYYREAFFAALILRAGGSISAIEPVLDDLEYAVSRNSPIRTVMNGVRMFVLAAFFTSVIGTVAYFAYAYFAGTSWHDAVAQNYFPFFTTPLMISAIAGTLGSIVSIILRLGDFEGPTRKSQHFLKMTGMMLPLVGAVFAVVTGAMFASGIVNLELGAGGTKLTGSTASPFVFLVIGFLAGFSERFTRGMLQKIEAAVGNGAKHVGQGSKN
jgi:hypothetical protein